MLVIIIHLLCDVWQQGGGMPRLVQRMEADLCLLSHSQPLFIRHVNILYSFICEAALPLLPISISELTEGL